MAFSIFQQPKAKVQLLKAQIINLRKKSANQFAADLRLSQMIRIFFMNNKQITANMPGLTKFLVVLIILFFTFFRETTAQKVSEAPIIQN
ncbi:MAG: hypothetical protein KDD63_17320, partial [Bacteroidetes bacterium]|nr:hypothetical protein [Bacteroidota bacterium]